MNKGYLKFLGVNAQVGAIAGALIGVGLSFTPLSPLVIGGIVGCAFYAATAICTARWSLYSLQVNHVTSLRKILAPIAETVGDALVAAVVGAALGIDANSLFPGVMSGAWTALLAGAVIGAAGTVSAFLVKRHLIDPTVEKVAECFSGKAPA